jgi:putative transposase
MPKRYSRKQINIILNEIKSGVDVEKVAERYGVVPQTIYKWISRFGRDGLTLAQELKIMGEENLLLRELLIDREFDIYRLKKILAGK